jgi:soluble lytic murein transglycosylase
MKILIGGLLLLSLCVASIGSNIITNYRLALLENRGDIPYGPLPAYVAPFYSFRSVDKAFDQQTNLSRVEEFKKEEFDKIILESLDKTSQLKLQPFLNTILKCAEEYQIDPFWVVSIIMVESNFNNFAISPKNARGLMQIKPDTALHLYQLMQKKISLDEMNTKLYVPEENIEIGVFYLKKLLQNFRLNYAYATVAYNIGPQKLRNRLSEDSIDAFNFSYKVKVRNQYLKFSQKYNKTLSSKGFPFEKTYVYVDASLKNQTALAQILLDPTSETLAYTSF